MEHNVTVRMSRTIKQSSSKDGKIGYDQTVDVVTTGSATKIECDNALNLAKETFKAAQDALKGSE